MKWDDMGKYVPEVYDGKIFLRKKPIENPIHSYGIIWDKTPFKIMGKANLKMDDHYKYPHIFGNHHIYQWEFQDLKMKVQVL